jgi:hypothetical protein
MRIIHCLGLDKPQGESEKACGTPAKNLKWVGSTDRCRKLGWKQVPTMLCDQRKRRKPSMQKCAGSLRVGEVNQDCAALGLSEIELSRNCPSDGAVSREAVPAAQAARVRRQ